MTEPELSSQDEPIEGLRSRLDLVDEAILDRLADRRALVERILARKDALGKALRDPEREASLRRALVEKGGARGLDPSLVEALYDHVIADSVRLQAGLLVRRRNAAAFDGPLTVAYHGAPGSYGERAARAHLSALAPLARFAPRDTLRDVVAAVERGEARFGILPVENSTAGSVHESYDLLASAAVSIVGEVVAHIDHCLAGPAEAPLASLRRILSHPMALAQCQDLFASLPGAVAEPYYNTALAARKVMEDADPSQAAIVSPEAARTYGLFVLRARVADRADNQTRFLAIAKEPIEVDPRVPCKTSLTIAARHEPGGLVRCLNVLAARGRNLTKLESRPRPGAPWEYLFYLDFEGNVADKAVQAALDELRAATTFLKLLGCYPAAGR